ncbi:efflux RND transporter periplasmic adaptor subunit [Azohydromonas sp.]|uniref:efflux RND transporter periplasmic adaptor subunit n=1 Tax=Azohydromonas sp. TaxID=1872666 RepID=UPI002CE9FCB1|nr:efflux RND transporter periplasmic adaptor subunit [Azohydromonas sp.]HMM83829.1 efflux RND transporter periplasmic adaptor subunit [Azohydromonas sp.]
MNHPVPPVAPRRSALLLVLLLAACGGGTSGGPPGGGAPAAPPPPPVGVITVQPQSVPLTTELPGRVEPVRVAQVRARVTGIVQRRLFTEGSEVRAGQPLFQIDPAPYQAALDSAQATLARAQAALAQASATAQRYQPLAQAKAVSEQLYADAMAARQTAEADVAAARAAVQTARINLDYARVTAPIAGRIGRALVTEGALVSAAEATQLALIQQVGTVYVNFTQSSAELLRLRQAQAAGRLQRLSGDAVAVRVVLDDGSELPRPGRLLFSDLSVDATSGQVTLRAEVPNADGLLLPGQYVRVRLSQAALPDGMLVPQQAVTRSQQGDTVLVVGDDNKPQPRQVTVAGAHDGRWIVTAGLKAGDRVVVDGFQKMFVPGAPVTPVPWQPAASASAAASAPAAAASR